MMPNLQLEVCHRVAITAIAMLCMAILPLVCRADNIDLPLESHQVPFDFASPTSAVTITPLIKAERSWSLCVLVPHMKDEYWISVHAGFKARAEALGVGFDWHEAGGYLQLDRQVQQIHKCVEEGHDGIIVGAVSADAPALLAAIQAASKSIPVVAFVNELHAEDLSAKVAVSWRNMGMLLGQRVVADLPNNDAVFRVSLVSGPSESGWAPILEEGLRAGLKSDRIRFGRNLQSDSDYHNQFLQVEKAVADCGPNHIIIGSAPAAEAAMSLVRLIPCDRKPKIYATYYSLAVKRGLRSGKIQAAAVDFAVLQGWLSVEQMVRVLEKRLDVKQVGPKIEVATPDTIPADRWAVITR